MPELDLNLWLNPEDVEPETEIEIIDEGELGTLGKPGEVPKEIFNIGIRLSNGQERNWTVNKTSQRAIAQRYGTNTFEWIGKKVTVFVSTQNVQGIMKKVIYAREPQ